MAGGFRRSGQQRQPKLQGKGTLEKMEREGPFKEWLGMPDLYRHTLVIDGDTYTYQVEDAELSFAPGDKVVFRYKEVKSGKWIDRNSLGTWIDPSTYNQ